VDALLEDRNIIGLCAVYLLPVDLYAVYLLPVYLCFSFGKKTLLDMNGIQTHAHTNPGIKVSEAAQHRTALDCSLA